MTTDHGWWGAQIIEPYVSERVTFAVKYHQALRFFPDPEVGYEYPESYFQTFGVDYVPLPHVQAAYKYARNHKWYMDARLVTTNDLYAFDPDVEVSVDEFTDIIGRHFRQPAEGLGYDDTPVSHMAHDGSIPTRSEREAVTIQNSPYFAAIALKSAAGPTWRTPHRSWTATSSMKASKIPPGRADDQLAPLGPMLLMLWERLGANIISPGPSWSIVAEPALVAPCANDMGLVAGRVAVQPGESEARSPRTGYRRRRCRRRWS